MAFLHTLTKGFVKYSPQILTGLGSAGMVTTVLMAIKTAPKANLIVDDIVAEKGEDLTTKEKVKTYGKIYWPVIAMGALSLTCFIGSNWCSHRHYVTLEAAYAIASNSLKTYQDKVIEVAGKKTAEKIDEKIVEEKIIAAPPQESKIIVTDKGKTLFFDLWSGRYFESDMEAVRRAINNCNKYMIDNDDLSLNQLYSELGMPETDMGDFMGWSVSCNSLLDISMIPKLLDGDDRPVIALKFEEAPMYNYGV